MCYDIGGYTVQEILSSFCDKILEIIDLVNKNEKVSDEAKTIIENIRNEVVPGLVDDIMKELQDSGYFDNLVNVTLIDQLRTELTALLNQTIADCTTRLDNFDSQMDTKANKNEVFTMANMGQDIKEAMTGGSVAIVGKNTVLTDNIVDGQVTENKTSFLKKSRNLLDETKLKAKTYISSTDGGEVGTSSYKSSDYIEITPNTDYVFSNNDLSEVRSVAYYDENKNFISAGERKNIINGNNENIKYIRISITTNGEKNQLEKGTVASGYMPYGKLEVKFNIPSDNIDGKISNDNLDLVFNSKNLINEETNINGKQISISNGKLIDNNKYFTTDFIEVETNENYVFSNNLNNTIRFVANYNSDKEFVSYGENRTSFSITNGNVKYIRLTIDVNAKNNQLEKGTVASDYEIYGTNMLKANISADNIIGKIPLDRINIDEILKLSSSRLKGKKIAFLGDSISDETSSLASQIEKYYYRYIQENTDCVIYMHGCAGTGFNYRHEGREDSINDRVKDIPNDADYIVVFAGTNDWGINNGTILGNMEDYLKNHDNPYSSIYSAIGNTIEKLVSKFPFGKIAFITPLPRWDKGADMLHGENSRGFTLRQVAKAIIEVCEWWSIPVLDLNAKSNICTNGTLATGQVYYLDGLHPNTKGNKEILAPKIQSFLETL